MVIDSKKWNAKKQLPDTSSVANKNLGHKLTVLKNRITESFNLNNEEGTDWLDELILGKQRGENVLWATRHLIDNAHKIRNQKGGTGLSKGRVRIYEVFERRIEQYAKDWKVSQVEPKSVEIFKDWLYENGCSDNYVNSFVARLKAVCNYSGLPLHNNFRNIKVVQTAKENIVTLTHEQLDRIMSMKVPKDLEAARRWLYLGCELGQRGEDLLKFKEWRILGGVKIIELKQNKTYKQVAIPINKRAWRILKDGFPEPVKYYKFNKLLKRIAFKAKIERWEEVSSHIMRRSFATNYYGKIPTPILMRITAHSKESTFLAYVGKSSIDNAMEAMEWFRRLEQD